MSSWTFPREGCWVAEHRVTIIHFSLLLSLPLSHEFPFNCDTSSGLWRTAHPVISRYYLGMRGQVLPVQSMSARCTVPWPLLSIYLYSPRSRENLSLFLDLRRSLVSQMRREFLPVRVLYAEGHP